MVVILGLQMILKGLSTYCDAMFDDLPGLTEREGVTLDGVGGVSDLISIALVDYREQRRSQWLQGCQFRPKPIDCSATIWMRV